MNLEPEEGGNPIFFWSYPREGRETAGNVKNVFIQNVFGRAPGAICMVGPEEQYFRNIKLKDIYIFMHGQANKSLTGSTITTGEKSDIHVNTPYPLPVWSMKNAPYNMFMKHVDKLKLSNVELDWNEPEDAFWGSAIRLENANRLEIDAFEGRQALGSDEAAIDMKGCGDVVVKNCIARNDTHTFIKFSGDGKELRLFNNDLSKAGKEKIMYPLWNA